MTHAKYRNQLPQLSGQTLLTDAGLETILVFHDEIDLPCFAAYNLMRTQEGRQRLESYYAQFAQMAQKFGVGMVLETATWRAHKDWGDQLGFDARALEVVNAECVEMLVDIRNGFETPDMPYVISGNIGPRGDGYVVGEKMSADEAEAYHATQIATLAAAGVDMISFFTVTYVEEAIGLTRAAQKVGVPAVISFTLETDGKLPSGQSLADAIMQTDAETEKGPAYYMINCAHPTHFNDVISGNAHWIERIRGIRANASTMSHEELDNAEELDDGNPVELGEQYRALKAIMPNLSVFGGCCGTDHRHVDAIGHACINHSEIILGQAHYEGQIHVG